MRTLSTLSGNRFQYKIHPDGELIVYVSDREDKPQNKSAIVITPYTINLVKDAIRNRLEIAMGASRDNPPPGSLGALIKGEKQSPQQLSYLIPILIEAGECEAHRERRAFMIKHIDER